MRITNSQYLSVCLTLLIGVTLPLMAVGQWVPFTAQYEERIFRQLPDGSEEVIAQFQGQLSRSSSGSEWRTKIPVNDGGAMGQATFKDAATGNIYHINHDQRSAKLIRQLTLPFLPSTTVVSSESAVGREVINGLECVGKPVRVNGQLVPGAHWVSESLQFTVKVDVTFPDGSRRVVEHSNFQYGEPSTSVFAIPEEYTTVDRRP